MEDSILIPVLVSILLLFAGVITLGRRPRGLVGLLGVAALGAVSLGWGLSRGGEMPLTGAPGVLLLGAGLSGFVARILRGQLCRWTWIWGGIWCLAFTAVVQASGPLEAASEFTAWNQDALIEGIVGSLVLCVGTLVQVVLVWALAGVLPLGVLAGWFLLRKGEPLRAGLGLSWVVSGAWALARGVPFWALEAGLGVETTGDRLHGLHAAILIVAQP